MTWYNMCKKMPLLKKINSEFEDWRETAEKDEVYDRFDEKLVEVAQNNDFEVALKTELLYIFKNAENEILIAWHNSHDAGWTVGDEGFDIESDLMYFYEQNILSIEDMINLFFELNHINLLTEKQQCAIENIFEYCKLSEQERSYFDKPYTREEYQNVYHNIWNNQKLQQKIAVRAFLEFLEFFY
jgi:hypothetical protein